MSTTARVIAFEDKWTAEFPRTPKHVNSIPCLLKNARKAHGLYVHACGCAECRALNKPLMWDSQEEAEEALAKYLLLSSAGALEWPSGT